MVTEEEKEAKEKIKKRLAACEVFHVVSFGLIVWKMIAELRKAGVDVGDNAESVIGVAWAVIFGLAILGSYFISSHFG